MQNILIGLKEGVGHEALLELACSVASPNAKLHLVTLVKLGNDGNEPQRLGTADARLQQHTEALITRGYEATSETGLVVAAGPDLLRIAGQRDADLIVIGLAKRSRVGKALMGSDAQRVLLGAECPVLTARTQVE